MFTLPRLSAYLYEETRDDKYKQVAEHTATFAKTHLFNGTVVIDHIDVHKCIRSENEARTYNSGLLIEGLSVLANVTRNVTLSRQYVLVFMSGVEYNHDNAS